VIVEISSSSARHGRWHVVVTAGNNGIDPQFEQLMMEQIAAARCHHGVQHKHLPLSAQAIG
jgi:hypothetical protein